ncbi:MAG: hypothetical protein LBQ66_16885 [Planctomycetaceae bacterium]|nr:hypothetical protein [Planctomycetaceae bacterium]
MRRFYKTARIRFNVQKKNFFVLSIKSKRNKPACIDKSRHLAGCIGLYSLVCRRRYSILYWRLYIDEFFNSLFIELFDGSCCIDEDGVHYLRQFWIRTKQDDVYLYKLSCERQRNFSELTITEESLITYKKR